MAIGAVAIKRLGVKQARIQRLEIDELVVRRITRGSDMGTADS